MDGCELGDGPVPSAGRLRFGVADVSRKERVQITADSFGIGGALGRMGLKIAGKKKAEKLEYRRGAVQLNAGVGCKDDPTQDPPEKKAHAK